MAGTGAEGAAAFFQQPIDKMLELIDAADGYTVTTNENIEALDRFGVAIDRFLESTGNRLTNFLGGVTRQFALAFSDIPLEVLDEARQRFVLVGANAALAAEDFIKLGKEGEELGVLIRALAEISPDSEEALRAIAERAGVLDIAFKAADESGKGAVKTVKDWTEANAEFEESARKARDALAAQRGARTFFDSVRGSVTGLEG